MQPSLAASLVLILGLLAANAACTIQSRQSTPTFDAGVELPAGEGREILLTSCLGCHELSALALFKGFYTRDSWRSLVLSMQENGAAVDGADVEVLADYLAQHFGPDSP